MVAHKANRRGEIIATGGFMRWYNEQLSERQMVFANLRTWQIVNSQFARVNQQIRSTGWYFQLSTADLSLPDVLAGMKVFLGHKDHSTHYAVFDVLELVSPEFLYRRDCYEHILNNKKIKKIINNILRGIPQERKNK